MCPQLFTCLGVIVFCTRNGRVGLEMAYNAS